MAEKRIQLDITLEINRMWNVKTNVIIPVITGATGTI